MSRETYILGAGVTGLAAARASGLTTFEAADEPGGICSSYYMRFGDGRRLPSAPADGEAYRFEIGGGHWLFGGDPSTLEFIRSLTPMESYVRRSSVFLPERELSVPYPIQNHLRYLEGHEAARALEEMSTPDDLRLSTRTMDEWIDRNFGRTLGEMFFHPFHELYTASLWRSIAPQDPYKSPLDLHLVRLGASGQSPPAGYNTSFLYPRDGLDELARKLASGSDIKYRKRIERIDIERRQIQFDDASSVGYRSILTTLPLNKNLELTGLNLDVRGDPYTSVLVVNIGAVRGTKCPDDHWVYVPHSRSGFHRIGFYSNVDRSFLPASFRERGGRVAIYVERAYEGGRRPTDAGIDESIAATVAELQEWDWIGKVDVTDPTWIDVAYTWSWPDSTWASKAIELLDANGIHPAGRYARWVFQGIAASIRDGLAVGSSLRVAT